MAILPAAPAPVSLDALLTRAKAINAAPAPRRPRAHVSATTSRNAVLDDDNHPLFSCRTEGSENGSSEEASALSSTGDRPVALILPISILHCACGSISRVPAAYVLVKYAANAHAFRFTRAELSDIDRTLPRETREHDLRIAFCEECF